MENNKKHLAIFYLIFFRKIIFFFVLFFSFISANSQVVIEKKINLKVENVFADDFDNFYILSDNTFSKYNIKGNKLFSYYPEIGNEITGVDVRNNLKILLFFSNQNKIVLLDNKLSRISEDIFLEKFDIYGSALVCGATNGGFWVYDNVNFKIIKLDSQFKLEYKRNLNFSEEITSITDNSSFIFFKRKSKNIFLYNYNEGNIFNLECNNTSKNIGLINNEIVYYNDNLHCLTFYNIDTFDLKYIKLPMNIIIKNAVIGKYKIFFFDEKNVYISSRKLNERINRQ